MRPLYFCANCKQYHATCNAKQLNPSNSIKYLRFSDLFNATPVPHLQNFTVNSPRRPEDSRQVYQDQSEQVDAKTQGSHLKITHNHGYYRNQYVNGSGLKDSKATADDRYNLSHKKSNNLSLNTKSKSALKSQQSIGLSREKLHRTDKKITVTGSYYKNTQSKTKQVNQSNLKNGPYYVVARLKKDEPSDQKIFVEGATQDTSKMVLDSRNQSRFVGSGQQEQYSKGKTGIKGSYVYGDKNRKILTSNKKITQFHYGELIESKEQEAQYQPNQFENINNRKIDDRQAIINVEKYDKQGNIVNHADKMTELRRILKQNQKNYKKQSEIDLPNRAKQSQKNTIPGTTIKISQNSDVLTPQFEDSITQTVGQLKIAQKLRQHRQTDDHHCKYYDNRCLGFSFNFCCKETDVDHIHETQLV